MTTNSKLDPHATALLRAQSYFTLPQYEQRAGLSHSAARRRLREWREAGVLVHHFGQGAPRHYTAPDQPPMLGRDARWRLIAQPLLEQKGFIDPVEYRELVRQRFSLDDYRTTSRDLITWVRTGRLQRNGPHGQGSIYLPPDADPQTWEPQSQELLDGRAFPLHRWVIARRIIEKQGRLTLAPSPSRPGCPYRSSNATSPFGPTKAGWNATAPGPTSTGGCSAKALSRTTPPIAPSMSPAS